MAVGLEIFNSGGSSLFTENSTVLTLKRKVTGTSSPSLSAGELAFIKAPNGTVGNTSKTYYIFTIFPTSINYGLEVRDAAGNVRLAISEGYAEIVGLETVPRIKNLGSTGNFNKYPAGDYAVHFPFYPGFVAPRGISPTVGQLVVTDFRTTSRGFESFPVTAASGYPMGANQHLDSHPSVRAVVINVAGL